MPALLLPSLLAVVAATAAPVVQVDGAVVDALAFDGRVLLSVKPSAAAGGARERALVPLSLDGAPALGVARPAPAGAVYVSACPSSPSSPARLVFADGRGVVDEAGARLIEATPLFSVADPDALLVAELCGHALVFPAADGLVVAGPDGKGARTLRYRHAARAYSGRAQRGLRPDRGYSFALSLYGPRVFEHDVDGDGDDDLIVLHERRLVVWTRDRAGALADTPVVERDLGAVLGLADEADLRIVIADLDGDARAELVAGVTQGAVPERSEAWVLRAAGGKPFATRELLWRKDGLAAPLGVREAGRAPIGRASSSSSSLITNLADGSVHDANTDQLVASLIMAFVDTSLVSLSGAVLTGRIPLTVSVGDGEPLAMQAKLDVRGSKIMEGAMPVTGVDFDGDGVLDLLDLGEPGRAALHKGVSSGYALDATVTWSAPRFAQVVPLPSLRAVLLIGAPSKGKTTVAVLRLSR